MCLKQKIHDAFAAELIDVLYSETSKTRRDAVIDKLKAFEPKVMAILAEEESKAEVQYVSHQTAQIPLCPQSIQTPTMPKKFKDHGFRYIEECQRAGARIYPAVFAALRGRISDNVFYYILGSGDARCKKGAINVQTKELGGPEQLGKTRNKYPWVTFMDVSDSDLTDILVEQGVFFDYNKAKDSWQRIIPLVLKDVVEYAKNPVGDPIWVTDSQYVQKIVDLVNK